MENSKIRQNKRCTRIEFWLDNSWKLKRLKKWHFRRQYKIKKYSWEWNALQMTFSWAITIGKKSWKHRKILPESIEEFEKKQCCQMHSDERVVKNPILSFFSFVIVVALSFLGAPSLLRSKQTSTVAMKKCKQKIFLCAR